MTKEEKKQLKAEKREARRERRAQNPSRVRRSIAEVSGGVQSVRELYRDMNVIMNEGYEPEENDGETEESVNPQKISHMRHAKGKFKIKTRPTTEDIWGFILDNELRTPVGIVGIGVDAAVLILFIVSLFSGSLYSVILLLVVLLITLLLIGPLSHLVEAYRISKNACSEEGSAEYTFSEAGFDIQYNSGEYARFTWDRIYRIQMAKEAFYFFLDEADGFVIPKKDIAAAGRKTEQFEELLEAKTGDKYSKTYFKKKSKR